MKIDKSGRYLNIRRDKLQGEEMKEENSQSGEPSDYTMEELMKQNLERRRK